MNDNDCLVWMHSNKVKHGLVLGELKGIDSIFDLNMGISFAGRFPVDAEYSLHPDFPNHLVPTDSLMNSDGLIVASLRLKDYLASLAIPAIEYHAVSIRDHKGKKLDAAYFIVHPIDPIDCLDVAESGASESFVSGVMDDVEKLVIKGDSIPINRLLFRISNFPKPTLIKRSLARSLDSRGFTGFRWLELSGYPEL